MNQIVYVWADSVFSICKIGKVDQRKRLDQRFMEALGTNPHIAFLGAWHSTITPTEGDAGKIAASRFNARHISFGTGAREWYEVSADEAGAHLCSLFGKPFLSEVPSAIANRRPWDPLGNLPRARPGAIPSADGLSRLWLHREARPGGLLKLSDNSWWTPNRRPTWANTFNPHGLKLIGSYEWPDGSRRLSEWMALNAKCRELKDQITRKSGLGKLPSVAQCGWLDCDESAVRYAIEEAGLIPFTSEGEPRIGVSGQGEQRLS